MLRPYKTVCEYCMGNIEYDTSSVFKDRFDTIFTICPLCDSQIEVPVPDEIDPEDIPFEGESSESTSSRHKSYYGEAEEEEKEEDQD